MSSDLRPQAARWGEDFITLRRRRGAHAHDANEMRSHLLAAREISIAVANCKAIEQRDETREMR
eukprot:3944221-Pleurochrysis_carterae.AAC.1